VAIYSLQQSSVEWQCPHTSPHLNINMHVGINVYSTGQYVHMCLCMCIYIDIWIGLGVCLLILFYYKCLLIYVCVFILVNVIYKICLYVLKQLYKMKPISELLLVTSYSLKPHLLSIITCSMGFSQTFDSSTYFGKHRDPTVIDKLLIAYISSIYNHPDYVSDNMWPHPLHKYIWDVNFPWSYSPHCPGMDLLVNACAFIMSVAMPHYKLQ